VAAGRRISAAEDAVRSWTSEREAWAKRLNKVEARVDGTLRAARKDAEEIAARTEQRVQAQLDERTTNLQAKVDRIQSAEQSVDARLSSMQGQLSQMQAANEQEVERLREEVRQAREAGNATLAGLDRQIARVDQRSDESRSDLESLHRRVDRERIGFEVAVNRDRELAPGVNLDVSHTDISHQRFDGWVSLMPDRRTIWIHGRGLQQPLVFYNQGDDRPRELVVTRVTKYSVVGYVVEPKENAPLAARR
jgi:chaperonin cofactor prefoldin